MKETITINATGRSLGRVATEVALKLCGKGSAGYAPNIAPQVKVEIINASQIKITDHKMLDKKYHRHSGYPGGIKYENLGEVIAKHGYRELFFRAVRGMVPSNRLRSKIMKNLSIIE